MYLYYNYFRCYTPFTWKKVMTLRWTDWMSSFNCQKCVFTITFPYWNARYFIQINVCSMPNWVEIVWGVWKIRFSKSHFLQFGCNVFWRRLWPLIWIKTWILFTKPCFVSSLVEIIPVVLEKKRKCKIVKNKWNYEGDDEQQAICKAYTSLQFRWAKID